MRVTQNSSANNAIYNIQQSRAKLDQLNELSSAGQKLNRPSDDPVATVTLLDIKDRLQGIDQYSTSISKANSILKFTDSALNGMSDIMSQTMKEVAKISGGSTDPTVRQSAHDLLVELKKQIIDMGNTQMGDQYIFGGAKDNVPPFNTVNNSYAGDSTQLTIEIAQNSTQAITITGDRLLLGSSTPSGTAPDYGSTNILQTFDNLISAVGDKNTASNVPLLTQATSDLQDGFVQITNALGDNIARMTRLDNMTKLHDNNKNMMLSIVSGIQDIDYAKIGVELNSQKTAFEASLSTTAKISGLSLLNYM
jgi:flagellar hook-associated protein 3 FlgL